MEVADQELLARYPSLAIDHDSKAYFRGCLEKKLRIARCADCGYYIHFPRRMCPKCFSERVGHVEVSGKRTIYLLTFYHQGRGTSGKFAEPHPAVSVELVEQERLRITSTIVNCAKENIRIGLPVELVWIDFEGAPVPAFQPADPKLRRTAS
jgi:uncharacterized OB-fold protein